MPTLVVLWEFRVPAEHREDFVTHYGAEGSWAQLFARDHAYLGTELLQDANDPARYVTVDRWRDASDYADFRRRHASEYARLDASCEALTSEEHFLGACTSA